MIKTNEKGFTLVELAVVMIIIGLLIGGILKGQELITNAQVSSTVAAAKGVDSAVSTFRDAYSQFPGDMPDATATVRLPNCAGECTNGGDGDSILEDQPGSANAGALGTESMAFWAQMNAADLVSGVQTQGAAVWGETLPAAPIGGGITAGFFAGGGALGANPVARGGHYISIQAAPGATAAGAGAGVMSSSQAARIDRKMDDGNGNEGSVFDAAGGACADATGVYDEANDPIDCDLYVRIGG